MYVYFKPTQTNGMTLSLTNHHSHAQHTQPTTQAAHQKTPTPWSPPSRQLPAASILMVSGITLCRVVAHDLHNTAMLLFFYEINSSFILFTIVLCAADCRTCGQKVCFLQWINVHFYRLLRESTCTNPICPPILFSLMPPKSSSCFGMILDKAGGGRHGHHDACVRSVVIGSLSLANFVNYTILSEKK